MAARLDYRWHLRQVMATRGMFSTTDLIGPLAERGIRLSSSQVYRLVTERPERLSLKILMALLDILDCDMADLIEPVAARARQEGQGGRRRGRGRGPAAQAGADHAGRLVIAPAEALTDPVGTIVSLVAAADPALERDLVRRIVEQAGGGRSKRRRLAVELAGNPSVLATGRSPASKAAGDLLIALRAAGATGISPPRCADCGRASLRCSAGARTGTARPAISARRTARAAGTRGRSPSATGRAGRAAASAPTRTPATRSWPSSRSSPRPTPACRPNGHRGDRGGRHQAGSPAETGLAPGRRTGAAHRGRREGAIPDGPAADRRALRGRRHPHQASRMPSLRAGGPARQERDGQRTCRNCPARSRAVPCGRCGQYASRPPATARAARCVRTA